MAEAVKNTRSMGISYQDLIRQDVVAPPRTV